MENENKKEEAVDYQKEYLKIMEENAKLKEDLKEKETRNNELFRVLVSFNTGEKKVKDENGSVLPVKKERKILF